MLTHLSNNRWSFCLFNNLFLKFALALGNASFTYSNIELVVVFSVLAVRLCHAESVMEELMKQTSGQVMMQLSADQFL